MSHRLVDVRRSGLAGPNQVGQHLTTRSGREKWRVLMMLRIITLAAAAAFLTTAPLVAQTTQQMPANAPKTKPAHDPNEMVCEAQKDPGSRLSMVKVCHTRAEWADLRAQDRQEIDRVQTRRSMDH